MLFLIKDWLMNGWFKSSENNIICKGLYWNYKMVVSEPLKASLQSVKANPN